MARFILIVGMLLCCICLVGVAQAGDNDLHSVTVQVSAINELAIGGGNITLTINSATAGSDPDDATDNSTCDLAWTTNEATKKITVETDQAAPTFELRVVAENVVGGTACAEVTLSTSAADFVTNVSTTTGSCDLAYTASATAGQGTGSDVHAVLYTVTAG